MTPTHEAGPCWHLAVESRLQFRQWDSECVVFHGAAGDTHRVPQAVAQLLQALAGQPDDAQALSERIDLHLDDVQAALEELRRLGIVVRGA
ncbi:HPr-rel-A system PqqD family peptide chaperone [Pseudorhodoferax aquiterrae]|uniref:HPr-rel-A system PqqD family peptide chaperone n=1 Tax=Pseudorhodoferax aquiterrae TaxID=747304 RepID=UPI001678A8DE|nr:HPr-rel-A system PqqD family peptide chaperone [Pseudorhodoferax aquiterrae]